MVADPADEDALAALRLAVRKALAADAGLQDQVRDMLVQAGVSISGDVANTISGGTQHGPVLQGRDFSNLTFGAAPAPPRRAGRPGRWANDRRGRRETLATRSAAAAQYGPVLQGRDFSNPTFVTQPGGCGAGGAGAAAPAGGRVHRPGG